MPLRGGRLPWSDIDLDERTVTIRETRVPFGADVIECDTRTDASGRTVSLDAGTLEVLRTHRRRQTWLHLQPGSPWVDTGLALTKADGAALVPDGVSHGSTGWSSARACRRSACTTCGTWPPR